MEKLTPSSWTSPARGRCDHELLGTFFVLLCMLNLGATLEWMSSFKT
jgi:hypothetical protein